jgi:coatomer protein complex subunit epsilon
VRDLILEYDDAEAVDEHDDKAKEEGVVRVAAGTIFIREGENEEAVMVLTEGAAKRDLEWCV